MDRIANIMSIPLPMKHNFCVRCWVIAVMMMFLVCGSTKQAKAFDFYQAIAGFGVIQNSIGNENIEYLSTRGAAEGRDLCVAIKGMGDFIQAHKKFNLALGNDYG